MVQETDHKQGTKELLKEVQKYFIPSTDHQDSNFILTPWFLLHWDSFELGTWTDVDLRKI